MHNYMCHVNNKKLWNKCVHVSAKKIHYINMLNCNFPLKAFMQNHYHQRNSQIKHICIYLVNVHIVRPSAGRANIYTPLKVLSFVEITLSVLVDSCDLLIQIIQDWFTALEYRKISNISRTKSQNLTDSRHILQLFLPNPLKPVIKSRMKM